MVTNIAMNKLFKCSIFCNGIPLLSSVANDSGESTLRRNNQDTTQKKKVWKIVPNPESWKCNVQSRKYQSGEAYINRRGQDVPAKQVKTFKNCLVACRLKCASKINENARNALHNSYYALSLNEKRHFLLDTTVRYLTARPKRATVEESSRRMYSFAYFFYVNGEKVQVCKKFYLGTLAISQKPVYTAHATKITETNIPSQDMRGKSEHSRRKPVGDIEFVKEHIRSFPVTETHYCKAAPGRKYLGSDLNVSKMFDLYLEKCNKKNNLIVPVKKSMYYKIFSTEFNLGFHVPKFDSFGLCEKCGMAKQTSTLTEEEFKQEFPEDLSEKKPRENK